MQPRKSTREGYSQVQEAEPENDREGYGPRCVCALWSNAMTTIGLIGAGRIGGQVARLAIQHGYLVVMSNSRGPETLADLVKDLGPKARAATPIDAAEAGDIVVVTIPLKYYRSVPVEPLAGKVVIDTNNYYPERDGHIAELDNESTTTAELLQAHLPKSRIVKGIQPHLCRPAHDARPARRHAESPRPRHRG
jgi:hypothetical protein